MSVWDNTGKSVRHLYTADKLDRWVSGLGARLSNAVYCEKRSPACSYATLAKNAQLESASEPQQTDHCQRVDSGVNEHRP